MNHRRPLVSVLRWVALLAVITWSALPIALMFLSSFKSPAAIFEFPPRIIFRPTLENYVSLFQSWPEFFTNLKNSFWITVGTTLLTIIVSLPAAFSYSRYRSRALATSAFVMLSVRMFPPIMVSVPLFPLVHHFGLMDKHLTLIVLYSTFFVSMCTWILKSFIDEIPRELDEAARIDGCGTGQLLFRIILPLSTHGLVASAVFTIVFAWKEFLFASLFTATRSRTAPIILNEMLGSVTGVQWGPLFAAATLQLLPILIFVILIQKYLMKGLTVGAVKG